MLIIDFHFHQQNKYNTCDQNPQSILLIFAVTQNETTYRQLALVNNVFPILVKDENLEINKIIEKGVEIAKQRNYISSGDVIAVAGGANVLNGYDNKKNFETVGIDVIKFIIENIN